MIKALGLFSQILRKNILDIMLIIVNTTKKYVLNRQTKYYTKGMI